MKRYFILLLCFLVLLPAAAPAPIAWASAPGDKLLLPEGDQANLARLNARGARELADYGAFSLWQLPGGVSMPESSDLQTVSDEIRLRGLTLDPLHGQTMPDLSTIQPLSTTDGSQFWLVQFVGPITGDWLSEMIQAGLQPVAYLPNNAYVVWGRQPAQAARTLQNQAAESGVQWNGSYAPDYRLAPSLRSANGADSVRVTIQFYTTAEIDASLARLAGLESGQFGPPAQVLGFTNVHGQLPANLLAQVAAWPDVFNIEPYQPPQLMDEVQGQIVAGNLTDDNGAVIPSQPGYLDWLAEKDFPTDPAAYPLVDVVDDGLDSGDANNILHPDFYELGDKNNPDRITYIANCTVEDSGNGIGGHGNLNAGILGGYNSLSGSPYEDANGYQLGLGISPYGPIGSTKVFTDHGGFDLYNCDGNYASLVRRIYAAGARITSNSWGSPSEGTYTSDSQAYDALTRDASSQAGNQQMLHVFAAGNQGSYSPNTSIDSPGSAKNVLTVGASENVRLNKLSDGCTTTADSADDIASFSSRGPTSDLRAKPDLVAPGTHIQGPASQEVEYTGESVCSKYYPSGQTLYTWSSGTSHSTPAAAGAAQLVYEYYGRVLSPGAESSPAMLKALLLNQPRFMEGASAGSILPSITQGWGSLDLGPLLDGAPRILVDQQITFTAPGQEYGVTGQVVDPARALAISLAWTDAPGNPVAADAWVNDLDLQLVIDGKVYSGNYFDGAYSATGGQADARNNVERIILPPGQYGSFQVRVLARNLSGDGVPGNSDFTDQDFALVISNGQRNELSLLSAQWSEAPSGSNENGAYEPGEYLNLTIQVQNTGNTDLTNLTATLQSTNTGVSLLSAGQSFPSLTAGETLESAPFQLQYLENLVCGSSADFRLQFSADDGFQESIDLPPQAVGRPTNRFYTAAGLPMSIPDFRLPITPGQVLIPISIADTFSLLDLNVRVSLTHAHDADLVLSLITPSGAEIILSNQNGSYLENYQQTIFDDQSILPIQYGKAPFTGHFRPEQSLRWLNGQAVTGTWKLRVRDVLLGDTGQVTDFTLIAQQTRCLSPNSRSLFFPMIFR